jgi:CheY-like chemotaxis protein
VLHKVLEKAPGPAREPASTAPAPPEQRKMRVLLAEDNLVNQTLAVRLLEKRGHEVVVTATGAQALEVLAKAGPFDLVLMDVQMPEMDGFEATVRIRQAEQQKGGHLPVIAMTAHAMKGDRERCLAAGMDGYLAKPLQPRELWQELERVADGALSEDGRGA